MTIRAYNPNDFDGCVEVFTRAYNGPPWHNGWTVESAAVYLRDIIEHGSFVGFTAAGGKIAGACLCRIRTWWSGREIFIEELFVTTAAQGRGIGRGLINAVRGYAAANDLRAITLLTDNRKPALGFYEKMGFCVLGNVVYMAEML